MVEEGLSSFELGGYPPRHGGGRRPRGELSGGDNAGSGSMTDEMRCGEPRDAAGQLQLRTGLHLPSVVHHWMNVHR